MPLDDVKTVKNSPPPKPSTIVSKLQKSVNDFFSPCDSAASVQPLVNFISEFLSHWEFSNGDYLSNPDSTLRELIETCMSSHLLSLIMGWFCADVHSWPKNADSLFTVLSDLALCGTPSSYFDFSGGGDSWYMITIVYVYNRWGRSEIRCYIDGKLSSSLEVSWNITSSSVITRCLIGESPNYSKDNTFCGRMTNVMGFTESLSPVQVEAIYTLGICYQGQFRFDSECQQELSESCRRVIYGGNQLYNSLMFAYTPSARDGNLCLNQAPKCPDVFAHTSHAVMSDGVRAVTVTSIHSALHGLGGMQALYPLFERLDLPFGVQKKKNGVEQDTSLSSDNGESPGNPRPAKEDSAPTVSIAATLLDLMLSFVHTSPFMGRQLVQTKGLLLFASALRNSSVIHLNMELVSRLMEAARELFVLAERTRANCLESGSHMTSSYVFHLLRQLHGYVFSDPSIWIRAPLEIQDQLYQFMTTEFLAEVVKFDCVDRVTTIVQCMHTLKYYFAVVDPQTRSGFRLKTPNAAPLCPASEVLKLRANLLIYIKQIIMRYGALLDAEMNSLLSYLLTVHEDENLLDVLYLLATLIVEYPSRIGPAFVRSDGLYVALKLLSSRDEHNRIYAIKLIGFYLQQSQIGGHEVLMDRYNLFSLMTERLSLASPTLSILTYNALFEVLVDRISSRPQLAPMSPVTADILIRNANIIKVIAQLIVWSKKTSELVLVKQTFLHHLLALCARTPANKRIILQLSVWQDFLLQLSPLRPSKGPEAVALASVMKLLRILLHHAIRYERDGWRVWIDTLALLHLALVRDGFTGPKYTSVGSQTAVSVRPVAKRPISASDVGVDLTGPVARNLVRSLTERSASLPRATDPSLKSVAQTTASSGVNISASPSTTSRRSATVPYSKQDSPDPHESSPLRGSSLESQPLPDFTWSHFHQLLLDDLLCSVEEDLGIASNRRGPAYPLFSTGSSSSARPTQRTELPQIHSPPKDSTDRNTEIESRASTFLQDQANQLFTTNLMHLLSDCVDMFVCGSGGLLPLLAAATSSTGEVGIFETVTGLTMSDAMTFVLRIAYLVDLCVLHVDLTAIEKQKSMATGALVRQLCRLYLTATVRNCLESRFFGFQASYELVTQLKLFANGGDGVRYVSCGGSALEDSVIRYADDHGEYDLDSPSRSNQTEADITSTSGGFRTCECPRTLTGIVGNAVEAELESMATKLLCFAKLMSSRSPVQTPRLGLCTYPWRFLPCLSSDQLYLLWERKQRHDTKIAHLPIDLQRLIYALRPTFIYTTLRDESFIRTVIHPLEDQQTLLQIRDFNRLQCIVYKSEEIPRVSELIATAIVYFISVLMVSKYRDMLEPNPIFAGPEEAAPEPKASGSSEPSSLDNSITEITSTEGQTSTTAGTDRHIPADTVHEVESSQQPDDNGIATVAKTKPESTDHGNQTKTHTRRSIFREDDSLTDHLTTVLKSSATFLRDLLGEYSNHFSRTLLNSQGEALLNSGTTTVHENRSPIELVMLLCSQEWQASLQKNAGLAFIELINEGRVMSRATSEHIFRVTQEAYLLLKRLHDADVQRHADFGQVAAHTLSRKREDENSNSTSIDSFRRKNNVLTLILSSQIHRLINHVWHNWSIPVVLPTGLSHLTGEPSKPSQSVNEFFRLDPWEDDSRRRRRLSPNPYGTTHPSAVLYDEAERAKHLAALQQSESLKVDLETVLRQSGVTSTTRIAEPVDDAVYDARLPSPQPRGTDPALVKAVHPASAPSTELDDLILQQREDLTDFINFAVSPDAAIQLSVPCVMISFGIGVHGTLSISKSEFSFERNASHPANRALDKKILVHTEGARSRWSFSEIQAIFGRRYLHRTRAVEIFVKSRSSVFFALEDTATVQRVVNTLPPVGVGTRYGLVQSRNTTLMGPRYLFDASNMTDRWQRREISNFDYLMYLNTISGRTYNDMNQYPIFPWILSNYTATELDLNEPSNYRDLSKPIGALDPKRKAYFDERYESWEDESQPPFHYGTHYSTAAFVLGYLLRVEPFTSLFLNLQGGKFDHPDRTFSSVAKTWDNCQRNTSDVKELIPEFFYFSEMFENMNHLDLGKTEDGEDIGSVSLPAWAATPEDFVRIHRQALESELVSCQLHHWIDLIFGYKQRGPEAVRATNVFHHLTYEGSVDWSKLTDPVLIKAVEDQIQSFGQTPAQLLCKPHPHRNSALHLNPLMFSPLGEEVCMVFKFYSNSPVVFVGCNTDPSTLPYPAIVTVTANRSVALSRWNNTAADVAYQTALVHPRLSVTANDPTPNFGSTKEDPSHLDEPAAKSEQPIPSTDTPDPSTSSTTVDFVNGGNTKNMVSNERPQPTAPEVPTGHASQPCVYSLGEDFDQCLVGNSNQYTITADNRSLTSCGYSDWSFRVFSLETGRFIQAIFGHFDVVTCINHSECQAGHHCYLVTGSRDRTVKLWLYNTRQLQVLGEKATDLPSPLVTLIGHESEVTSVSISAELGLVISGSKCGTCLLHTTRGVLIRQIYNSVSSSCTLQSADDGEMKQVPLRKQPLNVVAYHREGYLLSQWGSTTLNLYTLNGKLIHSSDLNQLAGSVNYHVTAVIFSACGRYIVVAGTDGVVWVLRSYNLAPVHAFPRCDASVNTLSLSKDQRYLMAGLSTGSLVVFYVDFSRWHHEFQERYAS
ncbi:unnamed protein product [Calicophoron daubneyi]|uniref:Neurobeachin n=1 Tax=Calicophoron daubneyi TaxID=300641 RepID=A0AAV2T304_CALDB